MANTVLFCSSVRPSLSGATGWINSKPLNLSSLKGKVVLIDFCTYTCINWRRTLPYVREWAAKYKDDGLVVIAIHTPEFYFEYLPENVKKYIAEMNINYPVAMDNNYDIWRSFNNNYWPARYLIDANGKLRHEKFGEGDYEESEMEIRKLLKEANGKDVTDEITVPRMEGVEAAPDWSNLQSPENFLGYTRTSGFGSPEDVVVNKRSLYSAPTQLKLNQWALVGEWIMGEERVLPSRANGKIVYRFHARDLHLIMGPAVAGTSVKFRVLINGKPPGTSHGLDIDSDGYGMVNEQRMYQLIRQPGSITDQEFQIEFLDKDVEVFDFTFG